MPRLVLNLHRVLDAFLHELPEGALVATAPEVELRYISDHAFRMSGRPVVELQALPGNQIVERWHFLDPRTRQPVPHREFPLVRAASGERVDQIELLLERADGTLLTILCKAGPIHDLNGEIVGCMMVWGDMTAEYRLRRELEQALAERETLTAEINRHLRSSLSLVASVIGIHVAKARTQEEKNLLREVRLRCIALARIHERLYTAGLGATVEFSEFLTRLGHDLETIAAAEEKEIRCHTITIPYRLPIAEAVPLALAVNELAMNAFKHAYPTGSGEIRIEFGVGPSGEVRLAVADHGVGVPEGFDPERSEGLGMQIVSRLVQQIGAGLRFEDEPWHAGHDHAPGAAGRCLKATCPECRKVVDVTSSATPSITLAQAMPAWRVARISCGATMSGVSQASAQASQARSVSFPASRGSPFGNQRMVQVATRTVSVRRGARRPPARTTCSHCAREPKTAASSGEATGVRGPDRGVGPGIPGAVASGERPSSYGHRPAAA